MVFPIYPTVPHFSPNKRPVTLSIKYCLNLHLFSSPQAFYPSRYYIKFPAQLIKNNLILSLLLSLPYNHPIHWATRGLGRPAGA
jgi:hypothetical protein